MQPNDLTDLIALAVDNALAPFGERIARAEAALARAETLEKSQTELRDRLVAMESKAAPPLPDVTGLIAVALTPYAERIASTEAKLGSLPVAEKALHELRDQVVAIEVRAAIPRSPDPAIGELREKLVEVTAKLALPHPPMVLDTKTDQSGEAIAAIRDRVLALETKGAQPTAAEISLSDLKDRLTSVESRLHDDATTKEIATLRERIAVLETRLPIPGPAGKDGKDGADGMGVKDFTVEHDGERTFTVKYLDGIREKTAGTFTVPSLIYRGIFTEGKTYQPGDVVTYAGNAWHCRKETTVKPDYVGQGPQPKDFWTLMVKEGREGKAGRDGRDIMPAPVVSIGGVK